MSIDLAEIERRLSKLRREWRAYPDKRPIIRLQAKALQRAKEIAQKTSVESSEDLYEAAKRIFS